MEIYDNDSWGFFLLVVVGWVLLKDRGQEIFIGWETGYQQRQKLGWTQTIPLQHEIFFLKKAKDKLLFSEWKQHKNIFK